MEEYKSFDIFAEAYNRFDPQPLRGEKLRNYYVGDFAQEAIDSIRTTVQISERFRKMLVIGHRGCGKSTILNKVAEELSDKYHVISFSALKVLNMADVSTVDILLITYIQLLESIDDLGGKHFVPFEKMMDFLKQELMLEEVGVNFLKTISLKFRVEDNSRDAMRKKLRTQVDVLEQNISELCQEIANLTSKDVLIIIDDLDKLDTKFAKQIFFNDANLLTLPEAKIIFTFPLESYYCLAFNSIKDRFEDQFISVVNLYDYEGKYQDNSLSGLRELVLKRIDKNLISPDALKYLIDHSGGLLRDLIRYMQDACKMAIVRRSDIIDNDIARKVLQKYINDYYHQFDFMSYGEAARYIFETKKRESVGSEVLIDLLRYLFVLEYRGQEKTWYEVHPCLKEILDRKEV